MERIGYRFYYLFIICNFTNALFFWLFLPEVSRIPLEKMSEIFSGSWIVVGRSKELRAMAGGEQAGLVMSEKEKDIGMVESGREEKI